LKSRNKIKTITDLLRDIRDQKNIGIHFHAPSRDTQFLSYAALFERAVRILGGLNGQGVLADRLCVIALEEAIDFFPIFWACILGRIIAAPLSAPVSFSEDSREMAKIVNVLRLRDESVLIMTASHIALVKESGSIPSGALLIALEDLGDSAPGAVLDSGEDDLAYLQFSSGSTGSPKGVMLTHGNVLANIYDLISRLSLSSTDVTASWLPHTHDMGLVGQHLMPLSIPVAIHKIQPRHFVRDPSFFLRVLHESAATWFCTPNFGIQWMFEKIDNPEAYELSRLRYVINGAEPISISLSRDFMDKFGAAFLNRNAMIYVYGLAEATLGVSIPKRDNSRFHSFDRDDFQDGTLSSPSSDLPSRTVLIADVGEPLDGISVRIIDEAGSQLPPGRIGEICLHGDSVTSGYYLLPNETAGSFLGAWFRTGDMGAIIDGRLVITGRKKDIIFLRGKNLYANDLEEHLYNRLSRLKRGTAAIAAYHAGNGDKVIVFLKFRKSDADFAIIANEVRDEFFRSLSFAPDDIVKIDTIPKTTTGKIQRYLLIRDYLKRKEPFNAR
jgi:acyl-CoA synthetase (AMP-forming)/AMP-acid ligase II